MCSHFVEKLLEATQMFTMVGYVREMTVKKPFMVNMDHLSIFSSCTFCALLIMLHTVGLGQCTLL